MISTRVLWCLSVVSRYFGSAATGASESQISPQPAFDEESIENAMSAMFDSLDKGSKAEMALELLFLTPPDQIEPPRYIAEGLDSLDKTLGSMQAQLFVGESTEVVNV